VNNLYEILEETSRQFPENRAVLFGKHTLTYRDLKDASDRLAAGLRSLGLRCGDRIALMLPNVPHFVIAYFALLKIGVTVIPISVLCKSTEIHHQLEDAEVRGIIYWEGSRTHVQQAATDLDRCDKMIVLGGSIRPGEIRLTTLIETHDPLSDIEPVDPDETALIIYTAGTTGRSKGAEFTHQAVLSNIESCRIFFGISEKDSVLGVLPLSLPVGLTLVMGLFVGAGGGLILLPRFEVATVFKTIAEFRPTYFVGNPAMYLEMTAADPEEETDVSSIRFWISTGDAIRQEAMERFESRFKGILLEGYGLTEAGPMVSFNDPMRERKAGSIGLPLPGVDIRIVDEKGVEVRPGQVGEILVQGPGLMKGYLNKPEATRAALADGWLHTGDLARVDESGFPVIEVRKKNVIIKSGFSVYPREVEKILSGFPKIRESVVVGLPDPRTGEEVHAGVVLKNGEATTPEEIITYSREMMAAYKAPKTVTFLDQLPKGPSGRVLREEVKQLLMERLQQS